MARRSSIISCKTCLRRCCEKMADMAGPSANISSCTKTHSSPQIRCVYTKRCSPGRPSLSSKRLCVAWPGQKNIQIIRFDRRRRGQPFQRSWTLDLERLCRSRERFRENFQTRAFEMATAFASGPGAWVHGRCHRRDGKTQTKNSPWAHRASVRAPVCCRSYSVDRKETFWSHRKKPFIPSPLLPPTDLLACAKNGFPPPLRLWAISTNTASFKVEGKERQTQSGHWKCITSKKPSPNPMNRFCIICTTDLSLASFARSFLSCLSTPSCRPRVRDDIRS